MLDDTQNPLKFDDARRADNSGVFVGGEARGFLVGLLDRIRQGERLPFIGGAIARRIGWSEDDAFALIEDLAR